MPIQRNTDISRNTRGSATAKRNRTAIEYGNDHGHIAFGKVHKPGDVTSGVMLQAKDGRHQFFMDNDGPRKGWTTLTSPGSIQFKCGMDLEEEQCGIFFGAENGDIDIIATNGKIRLQANDIELVAVGGGTESGHIKMNASESVTIDAKKVNATAKNLMRLATPNTCEIVANGHMKMIAGVMKAATDGCSIKDSKYGHQFQHQKEFTIA